MPITQCLLQGLSITLSVFRVFLHYAVIYHYNTVITLLYSVSVSLSTPEIHNMSISIIWCVTVHLCMRDTGKGRNRGRKKKKVEKKGSFFMTSSVTQCLACNLMAQNLLATTANQIYTCLPVCSKRCQTGGNVEVLCSHLCYKQAGCQTVGNWQVLSSHLC